MANTKTKAEKKNYIINFQADFPLVEKKIITQKNGEIRLLEVGDNIIVIQEITKILLSGQKKKKKKT